MAPRTRRSNVVITGISGRLGQLLARRLHRQKGVRVIGIDRRPFDRRPADVEHLRIDYRRKKTEDLFRKRRVDVIYHLGLMHNPRASSREHHSWNLVGTQRILHYAERYQVPKVVIMSSADVYGPLADNPTFISEDAPLLAAERFPAIRDLISVDMTAQSWFWKHPEIETVVLRPVHILGSTRNAVSNYLRLPLVPVLLGYDPLLQVLHEEDAVSAIIAAARPGLRGVYNVAGPPPLPLRALLREASRPTVEIPHMVLPQLAGRLYQLRITDMPAAELDYLRFAITVDDARFRRDARFRPRYSVAEAVQAALRAQVFDGDVEFTEDGESAAGGDWLHL
jgi:UDP-glucose 4-epimerase